MKIVETKKCICCGKIFSREPVWNNWKTYKINMADWTWKEKKYCSKKCGANYNRKIKYHKNDHLKNYRKKWGDDNKEKLNNWRKIYNKKPKVKERKKEYYLKNKKKFKIYSINKHQSRREIILKIYDYKCAMCNFKETLDIHHINHKGQKDNFGLHPNEYIVLCPNHHTMYHRGLLTKEEILKKQILS